MRKSITCVRILGSVGLFWFTLTGVGRAWELPEIKTKVEFQVEVRHGLQPGRPTAPWYAYFPVDPRMLPSPQTSPYPPWPTAFPPRGTPPAVLPNVPHPGQAVNAPRSSQVSYYGQSPSGYGMPIQPVGYTPAQAPSYWYSNR